MMSGKLLSFSILHSSWKLHPLESFSLSWLFNEIESLPFHSVSIRQLIDWRGIRSLELLETMFWVVIALFELHKISSNNEKAGAPSILRV